VLCPTTTRRRSQPTRRLRLRSTALSCCGSSSPSPTTPLELEPCDEGGACNENQTECGAKDIPVPLTCAYNHHFESGIAGGKSRFEMWYGRKADLDAMLIKVYGCPVEYGVPKLLRIKAGGRWRELTRSGYFVGHAGILVLVYDPDLHQIVQVSRQKCFFLEGAYTGSMPPADPHENPARLDKPDEHGRDDDDSCDEAPDVIRSEITHRNVPLDEYKSSIFDQLTTAAGPVFHEDGNSASELRSIENPAAHPRDALQQADNPTHVPVEKFEYKGLITVTVDE